jgi:putative pyruvate formate lyase activating enzyme
MKQSRRQFIKSSFYLGISALGSAFISLYTGCKKAEAAAKTTAGFEPPYLRLHRSGELKKRGQELWNIMESCRLCPRTCGVNKLEGNEGFCRASSQLEISSYRPHFGEERPLVGRGGSGAIFLTNCGLRCVFCINWEISQAGQGDPRSVEDMADMMLHLQKIGCHNINVVTPRIQRIAASSRVQYLRLGAIGDTKKARWHRRYLPA